MDLFSTAAGVVRWIDGQSSGLAGIRISVGIDGASATAASVIWWVYWFERLNIWGHFVISFQFWELNQVDQLCY